MLPFMEQDRLVTEEDMNCLDSQLWHACAGGMIQMPQVNAKVFYFVQGHIEHATTGTIDHSTFPKFPPYVLCSVTAIRYLADRQSDEVYARISLAPANLDEPDGWDGDAAENGMDSRDKSKLVSFAKTLTQSDANNGGGFSVPRYCAETIFPPLNFNADPPVQNIVARDVHGKAWTFRHIYRGTPRRHLLTTGWSVFVNAKKLVAGDSIVFLRTDRGELRVGVRRVKRSSPIAGWNPESYYVKYAGLLGLLKEGEQGPAKNGNGVTLCSGGSRFKGKVTADSVVEAATKAASGHPFEVIYYPRASTPEFVVKAGLVKSAMHTRWCPGMRFKMPFETEDSSRISWFMGTISSVQVCDASRWPGSPWRLLQVTWDEPDLLQDVKRVSPWLVEVVANTPSIYMTPFSPPRKKFRLSQHPDLMVVDGNHQMPAIPGLSHPFGYVLDNSPAGMQGARHAQYGLNLTDLHINTLKSGNIPGGFRGMVPAATVLSRPSNPLDVQNPICSDNLPRFLSMGNSIQRPKSSDEGKKAAPFILFGKVILTEEQMSQSTSGNSISPSQTGNSSSDGIGDRTRNSSDGSGSAVEQDGGAKRLPTGIYRDRHEEADSESEKTGGHCKVLMELDDIGRTLDLSLLASYEELCSKLANMFLLKGTDMLNCVVYCDPNGVTRQIGKEPFSKFAKTAKRLMILPHPSSSNNNNNVKQP